MSFTHSFHGYVPPVRYDADPWTQVRVQQSATEAGTYVTIDTLALTPVDTDPENPAARDVTTDNATLADAWFRLVFVDASADTSPPTDPVHSTGDVAEGHRPTVADVALLLLARTVGDAGVRQGTFNDETSPLGSEVDRLITAAEGLLAPRLRQVPTNLKADARQLVALRAAMLVELTYFPEQIESGQSPYSEYAAALTSALGDYDADASVLTAGREIGSADVISATLSPFPDEIRDVIANPWPVWP